MLEGKRIGVGITGSFCSLSKMFEVLNELKANHADLYIIVTQEIEKYDTRFYNHTDLISDLKNYTSHPIFNSIVQAELFGPKIPLDLFLIMPATSNTISKIACGICDNPVIMSVKATLRNQRPIVVGMYTNDALGNSGTSWISLLNTKNFYFVPFGQDDCINKPNSLVSNHKYVLETILNALDGKQIQPVLISYEKN